jgi:hypothetical protein
MSPRYPIGSLNLLKEIAAKTAAGGFRSVPSEDDKNMVVTPLQVVHAIEKNPDYTVSFSNMADDPTYKMSIHYRDEIFDFYKYDRLYIDTYGPECWDLFMFEGYEGENPQVQTDQYRVIRSSMMELVHV